MASSQLSLFSKGLISSTYCIISSEDDLTKGETHASTNLMKCFVSPANKLNRCSKVYVRSQSSLLIIGYAAQIAAMLALAVGIGWGYVSYHEHSWEALTTRISAPEGQRVNLKLQDGTEVWLNSGAELEYPSLFAGDTRRVRLAGEAFFDVSHDASKPFVVETFACRVEVLGTRFNVNADVQHSGFSTTLLRGSVRLTSLEDSRQQVVLKPDEKAVFENGKLTLHRADDPNEYLWVKGLISISGLDFKEVIHRMEHCYGVRINLNVAPIPTLEAMGKLRISDGIEHALGILQRNCKFNYMYNLSLIHI